MHPEVYHWPQYVMIVLILGYSIYEVWNDGKEYHVIHPVGCIVGTLILLAILCVGGFFNTFGLAHGVFCFILIYRFIDSAVNYGATREYEIPDVFNNIIVSSLIYYYGGFF